MGEALLPHDFESLTVSKRLIRSVSQKLKRRSHGSEGGEDDNTTGVSVRCLNLYSRGGGCKVGAETSEEFSDHGGRRRSNSNSGEEGKVYTNIYRGEETRVDCFYWKRNNNKKGLDVAGSLQNNSRMNRFLPDEILEMCLVRLPITSLMNARLVCKKWRNLTVGPRFMQMRKEGLYQSPWLFLFGVVKDGYCSGEIHALDVSLNQWHRIDAEVLRGKFMFSVAGFRDDVYVVGGCSSLSNFGKLDRSSFETHKEVLVFSPLTKSWVKVASMKFARSSPILGIFGVSSDSLIIRNQQHRRLIRSRGSTASLDVYEDPHRLSVRRDENNEVHKFFSKKNNNSKTKECTRFVLIAVGGLGSWDEPLDSGEIYDSATNKWMEIPRLPIDFGIVCSGVVCNGIFFVYSETNKIAGYDIEKGYWVGIQTSPSPPRIHEYYPKLVSSCGRIFMLSVSWCEGDGEIGRRNKAIRKVWELDLVYLTWAEVSMHPDAPLDWNAAFVGDRNMIFGVEMFKIFGQVLHFITMCNASSSDDDKTLTWSHISSNHHGALELDASSSVTKSMAVLHL